MKFLHDDCELLRLSEKPDDFISLTAATFGHMVWFALECVVCVH